MKTLATSMLLSVLFLSAGALAGGNRHNPAPQAAAVKNTPAFTNVTTVGKNRVWPPAGQISMEPCSIRRCIDA